MTTPGSNQDEHNQDDGQKRPPSRADKMKWMNNPETVHSMTEVAEENTAPPAQTANAFILTEGESVIASKSTSRARAAEKDQAWEEAIAGPVKAAGGAPDANTADLLSQWSGQKQARKQHGPAVQDEIVQRIRSEIDVELDEIRQVGYPLGTALILMARTFGKDPRRWQPGEKISNLLIEAVLYSAGLELPWGFDSIPDYAELKYILGQDRRFSRVYRYDKYRPRESAADFTRCLVEDGDIAIWISPESRVSGLIEKAEGGNHNIISAGCPDSPNGFIYTTLEFFVQTYSPTNITPDVVYRLIKLTS